MWREQRRRRSIGGIALRRFAAGLRGRQGFTTKQLEGMLVPDTVRISEDDEYRSCGDSQFFSCE